MLQLDANEVAARLGRVPLIDAPARQYYTVGSSALGDNLLLTMPAWQTGRCIGIKLATVCFRATPGKVNPWCMQCMRCSVASTVH